MRLIIWARPKYRFNQHGAWEHSWGPRLHPQLTPLAVKTMEIWEMGRENFHWPRRFDSMPSIPSPFVAIIYGLNSLHLTNANLENAKLSICYIINYGYIVLKLV